MYLFGLLFLQFVKFLLPLFDVLLQTLDLLLLLGDFLLVMVLHLLQLPLLHLPKVLILLGLFLLGEGPSGVPDVAFVSGAGHAADEQGVSEVDPVKVAQDQRSHFCSAFNGHAADCLTSYMSQCNAYVRVYVRMYTFPGECGSVRPSVRPSVRLRLATRVDTDTKAAAAECSPWNEKESTQCA